jgi:hypothetical protein
MFATPESGLIGWRQLVAATLLVALGACTPRVVFGDDRVSSDSGALPDLAALPSNAALSLGRYACDDLAGSGYPCQSIDNYSSFVYDRARHQMLWFGGGDHATSRDDVVAFDFSTLTWKSVYAPTPCADQVPSNADLVNGAWISTGHPMSRQTYDMLCMAESNGELVMLTYAPPGPDCRSWPAGSPDLGSVKGHVAHYDPTAVHWTFSAAEATTWSPDSAAEYDPASGLIVVLGQTGLFTYDPIAQVAEFRVMPDSPGLLGYSAQLVAFPPTGRMYYFTRPGDVFEVSLDRSDFGKSTVSQLTDMIGDIPAPGAKGWAYDPDHQLIGGGVKDGIFYAFEPKSRTWTSRTIATGPDGGPASLAVSFFTLAYDDLDKVFLFFTGYYEGGWTTWVYRY